MCNTYIIFRVNITLLCICVIETLPFENLNITKIYSSTHSSDYSFCICTSSISLIFTLFIYIMLFIYISFLFMFCSFMSFMIYICFFLHVFSIICMFFSVSHVIYIFSLRPTVKQTLYLFMYMHKSLTHEFCFICSVKRGRGREREEKGDWKRDKGKGSFVY